MSDMLDKRVSAMICAVLLLLVSVNKAYNDRYLSTEFRDVLLASMAEEERPGHNGDETLLRLAWAAKTEKDHRLVNAMVASSSGASAGGAPGVTPSTFSAFGDARQIPNGCNVTAFSRLVTCPSGTFLSGDKVSKFGLLGPVHLEQLSAPLFMPSAAVQSSISALPLGFR